MKIMPKRTGYFVFTKAQRVVLHLFGVTLLTFILAGVYQPAWGAHGGTGATPFCSEVAEGELCIPDGGPSLPNCYSLSGGANPNLSEGEQCAGDGDICSIQNGEVDCRNLVIGGCVTTRPTALVPEACLFSETLSSAFSGVTEKAVENILLDHELPATDNILVREYARGSMRASVFTELQQIITTVPAERTVEEQEIVDFYAEEMKSLRIRQAEISESEYAKFASSPCSYEPPEGFDYSPPNSCNTPLGTLFGNTEHPSLEEFKQYGVAEVTREDVLEDPEALGIAVGLGQGLAIGFGLAVLGAGAVFAILILNSSLAALLVSVTAPYAIVPFATGAFAGATGIIGGIAGIAGAVGIVIFAVVGSIFIILSFTNYADFEREVTSLVESAQVTPDLRAEVQTQRGIYDLHHVFIKSTQPEHVPATPVPAPTAADPLFEIKDEFGRLLTVEPSIQLHPVNVEGDASIIDTQTRLHGGWFVPTTVYSPQPGVVDTTSALSLSLSFNDWDGNAQIAWRRGLDFVIPQRGENNEFLEPIVTRELAYLDINGTKRLASIFVDDTPPVITATVYGTTPNGNGWYASDVEVLWTVTDAESDIVNSSGCEPVTVSTDGETTLTCSASSEGGDSVESITINRDVTPPIITAIRTPGANGAGWNDTDVTVTFACSDATSGVAICPPEEIVSEEGANQAVSGQAIDLAGNISATTIGGINIDKTPPNVVVLVPANQAVYVLAESVFSDWSVVDALSGVATNTATVPSGGSLDTSNMGEFAFEVFAEDAAGNSTQVKQSYTVLSPSEATARLTDRIADLGLPKGTTSALTRGLEKPPSQRRATNNLSLLGKIQGFINYVTAQSGKSIPTDMADELIVEAQKIRVGVQSRM